MKVCQPLGEWCIFELLDQEEKVGSIYVPQRTTTSIKRARVLAKGLDADKEVKVEVGDIVLFNADIAQEFLFEGRKCVLFKAGSCYCIAKELPAEEVLKNRDLYYVPVEDELVLTSEE